MSVGAGRLTCSRSGRHHLNSDMIAFYESRAIEHHALRTDSRANPSTSKSLARSASSTRVHCEPPPDRRGYRIVTIFPTLCSSKTPPSYSTRSLSSRDREWNRGAPEVESVREALGAHRPLATIEAPATLDGGDVLVPTGTSWSGLHHARTSWASSSFARSLCPWLRGARRAGAGCLAPKSAVTRAGSRTLVANPSWVDPALMPGWDVIPVDAREPHAGNVLWLGGTTIVAESFERTNAAVARVTDSQLVAVPASGAGEGGGGVTCCSILLPT